VVTNRLSKAVRLVWSMYDPTRKQVLELSKYRFPLYKKDGELSKKYKVKYVCRGCSEFFESNEIQVDHITPIGVMPRFPFKEGELEAWFNKVFCPESNLQILCKPCHKIKSAQEAKERVCKT